MHTQCAHVSLSLPARSCEVHAHTRANAAYILQTCHCTHVQNVDTHPLLWGHSALRNTPTRSNTPPVQCAHAHTQTCTHTCVLNPGRCTYMHTQPIFSTEAYKHTHTAFPHPSPPPYMHLQAGSTRMPLPGHARYQHVPVFLPVGLWLVLAELQLPRSAWHRHSCGPETCPGRGDVPPNVHAACTEHAECAQVCAQPTPCAQGWVPTMSHSTGGAGRRRRGSAGTAGQAVHRRGGGGGEGGRGQCQPRLWSRRSQGMGWLATTMPHREGSLRLPGPLRAESISLVSWDTLATLGLPAQRPQPFLLPTAPAVCLCLIKDPTTFAGCLRRWNK